jgi:hypothetical protein
MNPPTRVIGLLAGAALVLSPARPAHAERVRFHYAPNQICANSPAVPTGPGVVGERVSAFGGTGPAACQMKPNHVATFRHYYTGQPVSVPLRLPPDTPLMQHRANRIIYNYGSYSVEVVFTSDGGVDVVYNTGFLGRRLGWCVGP